MARAQDTTTHEMQDMQRINQLIAEMEAKRESEGTGFYGDPTGNDYRSKGAVPASHKPVQRQPAHTRHSSSAAAELSVKSLYVSGYIVLLHLLLLYCVVGVTFSFAGRANCNCVSIPSTSPTSSSETSPTPQPAMSVAMFESQTMFANTICNITRHCGTWTNVGTAPQPTTTTRQPATTTTTQQPTTAPTSTSTASAFYVGDFKISAQNESHANWKLCDGSFVDRRDYPQLFEVIGYQFGSFAGYPLLFQLPSPSDRVLGIKGDEYGIGTRIGQQNMVLTESNLPSHAHLLIGASGCRGYWSLDSTNHLSIDCNYQNDDNFHIAAASSSEATKGLSSSVGENAPFNLTQPTLFIGNLFIYVGIDA